MVRNPWAWHVSFYHFIMDKMPFLFDKNSETPLELGKVLHMMDRQDKPKQVQMAVDHIKEHYQAGVMDFPEFMLNNYVDQTNWLTDEHDELIMDDMFKMEEFEDVVTNKITPYFQKTFPDLKNFQKVKKNTFHHDPYTTYFDKKLLAHTEEKFYDFTQRFDYNFGD